jgi:hypothetical protein
MRHGSRFLLAALLVVPLGVVAAQSAGAATAGTKCAHSAGTATFKPALPVAGSSKTVKPKVTLQGGKTTACKGGGVKSGTLTSAIKFNEATNCSILLAGNPSANPPTGTLTTKWNTGATSVGSVTLGQVSGQATETHITGTVKSGLFKGLKIDQTLSFTPKTGDCVSTPLAAVTFKEVTPLTIS